VFYVSGPVLGYYLSCAYRQIITNAVCFPKPTPIHFICSRSGFAQAGVICYLLYLLSTATDSFFATKELPTQYTARNIAILIQTVVRGLAYLITFIFGANALGLASLGVALILAPDWVQNQNGRSNAFGKPQPELPKVKVTDDIFAIRRAFKEAEEMGRNREQGKK
jgi:hypothetical protein